MAEAVSVVTELEGWSPRSTGQTAPEGTPVVAWVRYDADGAVASDRGAALSHLHQLSPGLRLAVRALCRQNDVQIERGELKVHVPPGGELDEAVARLGRVCARVMRLA